MPVSREPIRHVDQACSANATVPGLRRPARQRAVSRSVGVSAYLSRFGCFLVGRRVHVQPFAIGRTAINSTPINVKMIRREPDLSKWQSGSDGKNHSAPGKRHPVAPIIHARRPGPNIYQPAISGDTSKRDFISHRENHDRCNQNRDGLAHTTTNERRKS